MNDIKITTISDGDLMARLEADPVGFFKEGYKRGLNISNWMNKVAPKQDEGDLDAFSRMMKMAGIIPTSEPGAGWWASRASDFLDSRAARALYTEYFCRVWRSVAYRAPYMSSDNTPGSWQRPYQDAASARWSQQLAPAIPLDALVAITTPIEGDLYRAMYLTYDATQLRMYRLGESAEIPIAKLASVDRSIVLKKFGRGLEATYEEMRRMRVDKLSMIIAMMAIQAEVDKVAAALDIIINGDGNANTAATTHDLTTLDSAAVAGTLTLKGWLAFKKKFTNPYNLTTALMQEAVALQLELLNTGSANVPLVQLDGEVFIGGLRPINRTSDNVGYGWTTDAPALQIVGIDGNTALEQVTEIGAEITEMDRFITSQTEVVTMTEVSGFAVLNPTANLILDVNA